MKNVGSYSISAIFNEEYFDIEQSESLTEGKFTFDYLISAIDFDLTDEDIVLSKNFNTYLGIKEVSTTVTHSSTNEILTIKLLIKPNSEGLYEDIIPQNLV